MRVASNYTTCAAGATTTIQSGHTITVYTIILNNSSATKEQSSLTTNADATIQLLDLDADAGPLVIQFGNGALFDAGLKVVCATNTTATVFHSTGGN